MVLKLENASLASLQLSSLALMDFIDMVFSRTLSGVKAYNGHRLGSYCYDGKPPCYDQDHQQSFVEEETSYHPQRISPASNQD